MALGAAAIATVISDTLGKAFDATAQIWVKKFDVDIEKLKLKELEETDRTAISLAQIKLLEAEIEKQKLIVKEATKQQATRQITNTVIMVVVLVMVGLVAMSSFKADRPLVVKAPPAKPELKEVSKKSPG